MISDNQQFEHRYTLDDVKVHSKERTYKGFFAIDQYKVSYKTFAGGETKVLTREIFERDQNAVAILPYDPLTDEVLLIEQFRPGALQDPKSPWLFEIVAGMIDAGEKPEEAAIRELNEEAHLKIDRDCLHYINSQYPSPGGTSERVTLYIATVSLADTDTHGGLEIENEDIRIFKVKAEEAFKACADGRICNAAALITLLSLQVRHAEFKK